MNPYDWFHKGAQKGRTAPLFIGPDGQSLSYGEMEVAATRLAATIMSEQNTGPRVAVLSRNHPLAFAGVLAAWRSGGAWVPVNYRSAVEDNIELLGDIGVDWLLYHSEFADDVALIRTRVAGLRRTICIDDDAASDALSAVARDAAALPLPPITEDNERIVIFGSSGGSTGRPKAIAASSLAWETMSATSGMLMPYEGRPRHLLVAPMAHAAGVLAALLMPQGTCNVLLDQVEPTLILDTIEKHGISHLFLPPTALYALLEEARVRDRDYSSLRYMMITAGPVSPQKLKEAVEIFGPCLCQAYGQAEAPFFMTWLSPSDIAEAVSNPDKAHLLRSCGLETPLVTLGVLELDGQKFLSAGEIGELAMRGNLRMTGYVHQDAATLALRDVDGWQRTGDVGYFDEDGYFYITDRKRDMIITGGYNVYCAEVEQALTAHPDVENAAIFGIPHPRWGEAVTAAVQLKADRSVSEQALIDFCRDTVGSVKAPKSVVFHDQLPRNAVGKILKRELRAPYWAEADRQVG